MDIRAWLGGGGGHGGARKNNPEGAASREGSDKVGENSAASSSSEGVARGAPDDLGVDKPRQLTLRQYPGSMFGGKKRSFVSTWFSSREWLEYSVSADAAFCFYCRQAASSSASKRSGTDVFGSVGFRNWKSATEKDRGFQKHEQSKEHLTAYVSWKERERRLQAGKEISTLVNLDQLQRNRYYVSSLIEVIGFLVENHLPLRGTMDAFEDMDKGGSGLFLSLLNYTIKKDPELAAIVKTIPRNATYTSHEIQNEIISTVSSIVKDAVVEEVGESYYTIKADGTRDPTGTENISIVLRYVNNVHEATERLLCIASADKGDAESLATIILSELGKAGLDGAMILSQVYDGAALMSGKHGGVQRLIQNKLGREVPYVHCFNHQLHLVVVHAMSAEPALSDFFEVCNALYKFCKKPTIASQYKGVHLKRSLEQRWTGHLATVSAILQSFDDLTSFLGELDGRAYSAEVRVEASGLLREIGEPNFFFIANFVHTVLALLAPANTILQGEETDLMTGLSVVNSATECVRKLRCEDEFNRLWDMATATCTPRPKRARKVSSRMDSYVMMESTGHRDSDIKPELKRVFFSTVDSALSELDQRFSERNSQLAKALDALNPTSANFLDTTVVQPILDLSQTCGNHAEFQVAKQFLTSQTEATEGQWTIKRILSTYHGHLVAMPTVLTAFKHALTFGASTSTCENSFSTLKNVFSEHRRSMLHERKAQLVQLAFERDLTRRFTGNDKDKVLRRFNASTRRLQLF